MIETCRICHRPDTHARFLVREMMFGLRETFPYFECSACGCLQLADVPQDLTAYYPPEYQSFARDPMAVPRTGLRGRLIRLRNAYALTGRGVIGRVLERRFPYPHPHVHRWLAAANATRRSRVLDVGCGAGDLLYDLAEQGFESLLGIDPLLADDVAYDVGVVLRKAGIHELQGEFDLILFNHSLEHIPDQLETLRAAADLLAPGGTCIVRAPVASSYAWQHYREHWVQIDAPRHLFLHSEASLSTLARNAGLEIRRIEHDSTEFQFSGSEAYMRDRPLTSTRGNGRLFSRRELRRFRRAAERLNREGRGDQAVFYLRRP